ncbi:ATP-binding protein [Thermococcus sp. AM4]|uniref:AAA family ATPase n=1 Tax=Thermococcus sp. (strain AM4) TaxID=246969 RepID=UPI0001870D03|nr:ATP-binding protein [Thermococcus sp. AM4]EEB73557.1 archeal ATPase family protein [Thermococcus sp. AM4]
MQDYFNVHPRTELKMLYGRKKEVEKLLKVLHASGWAVVLGPRMAGKTSLSIATAVEYSKDARTAVIYLNLSTAKSFRDLTVRLVSAVSKLKGSRKSNINAEFSVFIPTGLGSLGFSGKLHRPNEHRVSESFEDAIMTLPPNTVIILDEIQEVKGRLDRITRAFWVVFNERPDIRIVFTGSYSGVVKKVAEAHHEEPMFGRPPVQIKVLPWARKTAEEFLIKGLKGCGVNYEDVEIDETISLLGTLPGWLNEYGFRRCIGESHSEALSIVSTSAVQRAKRELENILKGRGPASREVVRKLSEGPKSWSELLSTGISKPSLSSLLEVLTDGLFLLKKETIGHRVFYSFTNPVYRDAARLL